jgi:acyl-CoA synthetase (AMP-forming)/AMP-acid ligase II
VSERQHPRIHRFSAGAWVAHRFLRESREVMSSEQQPGPVAQLIERQAAVRRSATLLEDARGDRMVSYADLAVQARRWRATLADVPPAGRVLLDIADPVAFATAFLGIIAAGRCAVPVNPQAPDRELDRTVGAVSPVAVVGDRADRVARLGLPSISPTTLDTEPAGTGDSASGGTGAVLLLTSGSTGTPKAVELTEDRLVHVAGRVAAHHRLTEHDRGFNPLPLFHINAEVVALLGSLCAGATVVLDSRFRRGGFWELVTDRDITWINAVPAILTILAAEPVPVVPPRLRLMRSASAPLAPAVKSRIAELTGVCVVESYGMTEAASQITATPLSGAVPAGSAGRPVGIELQIRDAAGQVVPPGQVGTVRIRGAGVIDGYVGGAAEDRFDSEGWLDTRDLGYLDADGFLFLVGRTDDVINRGGEMLYPREIEEVLAEEPGVTEAAVVGRPDPILGHVPVAFVVTVPAGADDGLVDRLHARCAEHLSRFKRPVAITVVAELPRAATGKIARHRLRELEPEPVGT